MPGTVILGIGKESTLFIEALITEIVNTRERNHNIIAVGIYDDSANSAGPKVQRSIRRRTKKKLHADYLVRTAKNEVEFSDPTLDDLVDLRKEALDYRPTSLLLFIDAEFLRKPDYVEVFRQLRVKAIQISMTAICFTHDTANDQEAYAALEKLTRPDTLNNGAPILEAAFMVRTNSPLAGSVAGWDTQYQLLARSLAGIWIARHIRPSNPNYNPDFNTQVSQVRQIGKPFIGMAVKTRGLSMKDPKEQAQAAAQPQPQPPSSFEPPAPYQPPKPSQSRPGFFTRLLYPILRHTTWRISAEEAADTINTLTRSVLRDMPAVTTVQPFTQLGVDVHELPISVNFIVPFRPNTAKFNDLANLVESMLRNHDPAIADRGYNVVVRSIIRGRGVDLSKKRIPGADKGKFYCQVCVLYAVDRQHISPSVAAPASSTTAARENPANPIHPVNPINAVHDREG